MEGSARDANDCRTVPSMAPMQKVPTEPATGKRPMGRPHKGPRTLLQLRVSVDLHQAVRDAAKAKGLTITDYVADVLTERTSEHAA